MTSPRPTDIKKILQKKGVSMPCPESVWFGDDINPEWIAAGSILWPGCRIRGSRTVIGPGCELGSEAPVTLDNCQLEEKVALRGGVYYDSTFLAGASTGSGAHVRAGCLLEEQASCAHTVGLKQTILMPYVTLGSLINFCDCLMAGGTSRSNHSEVGSSYIHFNYTPHQDKATPSLIGDVPHGVCLNQPPVFLGGQGGLVGPARIAFGTIVAAGSILRHDVEQPGMLVMDGMREAFKAFPYRVQRVRDLQRILIRNVEYIGNLLALHAWYLHIRMPLASASPFRQQAYEGACSRLEEATAERIRQLEKLVGIVHANLPSRASPTPLEQRVTAAWPEIRETFCACATRLADMPPPRPFAAVTTHHPGGYLTWIHGLSEDCRQQATAWLQRIVHETTSSLYKILPELQPGSEPETGDS